MANETKEILRIAGPLANLGLGQIGYELENDPALGFKMWGGKDASGVVSKFLAKGKPGLLQTLTLSGATTTGEVGFLKHDEQGNITGGYSSTVDSITEINDVDFTKDVVNDEKILKYNNATQKFEAAEESGGISNITEADDVDFTKNAANDTKVLKYNNATQKFEAGEAGGTTANQIVADVQYQAAVSKGDPLFITDSSGGVKFVRTAVDDEEACFVADADYNGGDTGTAIIIGCLTEIDTSLATQNAKVFKDPTGGYTFVEPSEVSQQIGIVTKVGNATAGEIGVKVGNQVENDKENGFQGDALAVDMLCYRSAVDGKFYQTNYDDSTTCTGEIFTVLESTNAVDEACTVTSARHYVNNDFFNRGDTLYVGLNGLYQSTAPSTSGDIVRILGYSEGDTIMFDPSKTYFEVQ